MRHLICDIKIRTKIRVLPTLKNLLKNLRKTERTNPSEGRRCTAASLISEIKGKERKDARLIL